jgi:predicted Na+-dependent transporter
MKLRWAWLSLGRFISKHLVLLIPLCLVIAIFAPGVFSPLRPLVPTLFALMTFQSSLGNRIENFRRALAHPAPIICVIAFAHVILPLAAWLLGRLVFGSDPDIVAGIVLEYSVPIATTMVMRVSLYEGSTATALAALMLSTLIAPFSIPATLQILLGAQVHVETWGMIRDMLYMTAIPALAALAFNELSHGWASEHVSQPLAPAARIALLLIVTTNTTSISDYILHLTPQLGAVLVFIGLFAAGSYLCGILVARATHQPRATFTPVAFGCGMRNISAGAVLAAQYFPAATIFPVIVGTLFQQILAALFGKLMKRQLDRMDDAPAR